MKFCAYCGKSIPDEASFCPYCGKEDSPIAPQPPEVPETTDDLTVGQTVISPYSVSEVKKVSSQPPAPEYAPMPAYASMGAKPHDDMRQAPQYGGSAAHADNASIPTPAYVSGTSAPAPAYVSGTDVPAPAYAGGTSQPPFPPSSFQGKGQSGSPVFPANNDSSAMPYVQMQAANAASTAPAQTGLGMKWYKFLLYFFFWACAGFSFLYALTYFRYDEYYYSWMLAVNPLSRVFDILAGVASLLLAAYAVYVWLRLRDHKADAPLHVMVFGAARLLPGVLSTIGTASLDSMPSFVALLVANVLSAALWVVLNRIYFIKRSSLFDN